MNKQRIETLKKRIQDGTYQPDNFIVAAVSAARVLRYRNKIASQRSKYKAIDRHYRDLDKIFGL